MFNHLIGRKLNNPDETLDTIIYIAQALDALEGRRYIPIIKSIGEILPPPITQHDLALVIVDDNDVIRGIRTYSPNLEPTVADVSPRGRF